MVAADSSIPSVWARQEQRREQPALSRERIVAEAVRLLDEQGLESLSMRMLGRRLDAGATSMYRHIASKDELIELVVDEVYAEVEVPGPAGPGQWRTGVAAAARSLREMALRHPWVTGMLGQAGPAYLGPNLSRTSEGLLDILKSGGFDRAECDRAMSAVVAYVVGTVMSEAARLSLVARSRKAERETQEHDDPAGYREETFQYGLDRLLDGLASRLADEIS
ncbi:TetR/AcrR family transcriptional regulator [Glycomyces sp. L485]|uniref:TetR/AcrR family transcriptional regulator n=1 Tax=Glycomyces sp. L485 TaxID=2909235 RepID=UPI001F4A0E7D|nr:TetR/AcrR family transcriptional regulator [Glycomyces sp. L485]MCH7230862.1 TetR/AcrR family transcriptional regulator [Glycomyces sp. L485]